MNPETDQPRPLHATGDLTFTIGDHQTIAVDVELDITEVGWSLTVTVGDEEAEFVGPAEIPLQVCVPELEAFLLEQVFRDEETTAA